MKVCTRVMVCIGSDFLPKFVCDTGPAKHNVINTFVVHCLDSIDSTKTNKMVFAPSKNSDQSLPCQHEETLGASYQMSAQQRLYQTGWTSRLIFAGGTGHFVYFVALWLIAAVYKSNSMT